MLHHHDLASPANGYPGLSVREYFALHALNGLIALPSSQTVFGPIEEHRRRLCREAVEMADNLIRALNNSAAFACREDDGQPE